MPNAAPGASFTAIIAAKSRAIHQIYAAAPRILDDPIAARLLGADFDGTGPVPTGPNTSVALRSRWAEDRLAEAVQRGVSQVVVLGAGLDTFAYRQPAWGDKLRVFEVDHHASQEDKRRRLAEGGVSIPSNLEFVPIDFEKTTLRDGLKASSLDFRKPTFFYCLGVMGYLTAEAVMTIFEVVAEFPAGSEIAFTYFAERPPAEVLTMTSQVGEPLLSHFDPEALKSDLLKMGFGEVVRLTREEADRRYFQGRTDGLCAPEWPVMAAAVVGGKA
jgi:methyltransferase (TIGR00027 family)